jgi:hypothetical protein
MHEPSGADTAKLGAMKDAWSEDNDGSESSSKPPSYKNYRPSFLTGLAPPPKRSVVMASLPFREAADKLVAHFFAHFNPAVPARCKYDILKQSKT